MKRKEKEQKQNRAGREGDEKKKRAWDPLYAEGESLISMSAGLIGNFQQAF